MCVRVTTVVYLVCIYKNEIDGYKIFNSNKTIKFSFGCCLSLKLREATILIKDHIC